MDLKPRSHEKIVTLINKGVDIPNPLTLDIGDEVDIDRISAKGVKIYPGCRIYGKSTVISSGTKIGQEGSVTIDNCQIGQDVELKGGYFSKSVFLDKSNMGLGAHVREGSILEEEAGGAHCVGLKQTILFPFVTLGSLINFCDCLMAGGTSRKNHSEVGSSYIHFNFTPDQDKTTPSLLGDVPRGVMLKQPPIFLGGQGGIVGPIRMGFGTVVSAGSVLRKDYPDDNKIITGETHEGCVKDFLPALYPNLPRIIENNIIYLANLSALEEWYTHVRKLFLEGREFGPLIHAGLLDKISLARKERLKRLEAMAKTASLSKSSASEKAAGLKKEFGSRVNDIQGLSTIDAAADSKVGECREEFITRLKKIMQESSNGYVETIQGLPADVSSKGTQWLECVVANYCKLASAAMPGLELFKV